MEDILMENAIRYTEAFTEGIETAKEHYKKVDKGEIKERPLPDNPYCASISVVDNCNWCSWNRGWNEYHLIIKQYGQKSF